MLLYVLIVTYTHLEVNLSPSSQTGAGLLVFVYTPGHSVFSTV